MYRKKLKRVGTTLLFIGLLDIAYTIYCLINQKDYIPSFSIFSVVSGIYLIRGNLRAANYVSIFSILILTSLTGFFIFDILLKPLDFWLIFLRVSAQESFREIVSVLLFLGFLFWIYRELSSKAVIEAIKQTDIRAKPIVLGFIVGIFLPIITTLMIWLPTRGETAHFAIQEARKKYGSNYKYLVHNVSISYYYSNVHSIKRNQVSMTRYNHNEIRDFNFVWDEPNE